MYTRLFVCLSPSILWSRSARAHVGMGNPGASVPLRGRLAFFLLFSASFSLSLSLSTLLSLSLAMQSSSSSSRSTHLFVFSVLLSFSLPPSRVRWPVRACCYSSSVFIYIYIDICVFVCASERPPYAFGRFVCSFLFSPSLSLSRSAAAAAAAVVCIGIIYIGIYVRALHIGCTLRSAFVLSLLSLSPPLSRSLSPSMLKRCAAR